MDGHAASAKQQKRAFEGYPSRRDAPGAKVCLTKAADGRRGAGRLRRCFYFCRNVRAARLFPPWTQLCLYAEIDMARTFCGIFVGESDENANATGFERLEMR